MRWSARVPQRLKYHSQRLSQGKGRTRHRIWEIQFCATCWPCDGVILVALHPPAPAVDMRPPTMGGATEPLPVPGSGDSDVCCADASSLDPCTCCSRRMRDTPRAVCCALTSQRLPVTARTNYSHRSRLLDHSIRALLAPFISPRFYGWIGRGASSSIVSELRSWVSFRRSRIFFRCA
jgi:hypothetical protein